MKRAYADLLNYWVGLEPRSGYTTIADLSVLLPDQMATVLEYDPMLYERVPKDERFAEVVQRAIAADLSESRLAHVIGTAYVAALERVARQHLLEAVLTEIQRRAAEAVWQSTSIFTRRQAI